LVVLDTSALLASMNLADPDFHAVTAVMREAPALILPAGIMAEVTFMIALRFGEPRVPQFLHSLVNGELSVQWEAGDLPRILHLVDRYHDLPLGYADAAVIACAERNGGKVLTLDHRHFGVVAREGTIQIVP
jgi:predicted nucleic acid-binding protein